MKKVFKYKLNDKIGNFICDKTLNQLNFIKFHIKFINKNISSLKSKTKEYIDDNKTDLNDIKFKINNNEKKNYYLKKNIISKDKVYTKDINRYNKKDVYKHKDFFQTNKKKLFQNIDIKLSNNFTINKANLKSCDKILESYIKYKKYFDINTTLNILSHFLYIYNKSNTNTSYNNIVENKLIKDFISEYNLIKNNDNFELNDSNNYINNLTILHVITLINNVLESKSIEVINKLNKIVLELFLSYDFSEAYLYKEMLNMFLSVIIKIIKYIDKECFSDIYNSKLQNNIYFIKINNYLELLISEGYFKILDLEMYEKLFIALSLTKDIDKYILNDAYLKFNRFLKLYINKNIATIKENPYKVNFINNLSYLIFNNSLNFNIISILKHTSTNFSMLKADYNNLISDINILVQNNKSFNLVDALSNNFDLNDFIKVLINHHVKYLIKTNNNILNNLCNDFIYQFIDVWNNALINKTKNNLLSCLNFQLFINLHLLNLLKSEEYKNYKFSIIYLKKNISNIVEFYENSISQINADLNYEVIYSSLLLNIVIIKITNYFSKFKNVESEEFEELNDIYKIIRTNNNKIIKNYQNIDILKKNMLDFDFILQTCYINMYYNSNYIAYSSFLNSSCLLIILFNKNLTINFRNFLCDSINSKDNYLIKCTLKLLISILQYSEDKVFNLASHPNSFFIYDLIYNLIDIKKQIKLNNKILNDLIHDIEEIINKNEKIHENKESIFNINSNSFYYWFYNILNSLERNIVLSSKIKSVDNEIYNKKSLTYLNFENKNFEKTLNIVNSEPLLEEKLNESLKSYSIHNIILNKNKFYVHAYYNLKKIAIIFDINFGNNCYLNNMNFDINELYVDPYNSLKKYFKNRLNINLVTIYVNQLIEEEEIIHLINNYTNI